MRFFLIITVSVLLAGCGDANETPVTPGEDYSAEITLRSKSGELWIGFRLSDSDKADSGLTDGLTAFVENNDIGEWTGQSIGAGQRDITFDVEDMSDAAESIREYFRREAPSRDFWISDDYETFFDENG